MEYFFCCKNSASLKINGLFNCNLSNKPININKDLFNCFIEVCPEDCKNYQTISFVFNKEFLLSPKDTWIVTDLKGGYIIEFLPKRIDNNFELLSQKVFNFSRVTAFNQNGLNLSFETSGDFFTENFNIEVQSVEIKNIFNNVVAIIIKERFAEKINVILFQTKPKITKILSKQVTDYSFFNTLKLTENFVDIAKHQLITTWNYKNDGLFLQEKTLNVSESFNVDNLNEKILPYCFFEEILLDGEYHNYLGENLIPNAPKLKEFLGDFIGVITPPKFIDQEKVGLVYKTSTNVYTVKYALTELKDRKIVNVKLE